MKKRKNLLLLFIALMISVLIQGQDEETFIHNIVPPSPTAASLAKYAEIPVSLYTGVPGINIPLWEAKSWELSLPISLSYHASGVKVDELPGWTGLGWALNAGGVITRTLRGRADENPINGYFDVYHNYRFDTMDLDHGDSWDFLYNVADGQYDTQPDMFSFNVNGRTGQFVIEPSSREVKHLSQQMLKIDPVFSGMGIAGWTMLDESGTVYHFNHTEHTTQYSAINGNPGTPSSFTSGWYLSEMISPLGTDTISFTYKVVEESNDIALWQEKYYNDGSQPDYTCEFDVKPLVSVNNILSQKLEKIRYRDFEILFETDNTREDMQTGDGSKLQAINVYYKDVLKRNIVFTYDYFSTPSPLAPYKGKRLKLVSVQESAPDGTIKNPYRFTYEETTELPPRFSYDQDYWGYYNGHLENTSLFPYDLTGGIKVTDANREANPAVVHAGMLTRLEYPTGGYSDFTYEAHDYGYVENEIGAVDEATETETYTASLPPGSTSSDETRNFLVPFEQDLFLNPDIHENDTRVQAYLMKFIAPDNEEAIASFSSVSIPRYIHIYGPGTYFLKIIPDLVTGQDPVIPNSYAASLAIQFKKKIPGQYFRYAGGARIQQITDKASSTDQGITRTFGYRDQENGSGFRSSGILITRIPNFQYDKSTNGCNYQIVSTVPLSQAAYTRGSHVGYSKVTVFRGDTANHYNGKEVHTFTSALEYPNTFFDLAFPFPPVVSCDWRRGKIKEKKIYTHSDTLVQHTRYTYLDILYPLDVPAVKAGFFVKSGGGAVGDIYDAIEHTRYHIDAGWNYPGSEQTTDYYYGNGKTDSTVVFKEYTYNPSHLQLSRVATSTSDQAMVRTDYTYPFDEPLSGPFEMRTRHMVNTLLKKEEKIITHRDTQKVVSGNFTEYDLFGAHIRPRSLETYDPSLLTYNSDSTLITPGAYVPKILADDYDNYGNILQYHKTADIPVSFLWGYMSSYPIAKIEGATHAEVLSQLTPEDAALLKGNTLTDLQIRSKLAVLRGALPDAAVTIYTYDPVYGQMTSVTDPNGKTTYYTYDGLGRLVYIKDHQGQITETFEYQYHQ